MAKKIKSILVTGSEGFIGKHFCQYLSKKYDVIGIDRVLGQEVSALTEEYVSGFDAVIHLAAQTSVWNENDELIVNDNINSFIKLFNICKKLNKRFVFASSSCAINVTSTYGLTKFFDEEYVRMNNYHNCVGIRLHNVYGLNSRENTLLGVLLNNDKVTLYNNGLNKRHFTHINDACYVLELGLKLKEGLYNAYNPEEITTLEFTNLVKKYKDVEVELTDEIKGRDKDIQKVDWRVINLLDTYHITVFDGLYDVFYKMGLA